MLQGGVLYCNAVYYNVRVVYGVVGHCTGCYGRVLCVGVV